MENYSDAEVAKLCIPMDKFKDQTLFLSRISQEALRRTMFPLANCTKQQVRQIAKEIGLGWLTAKRESTGMCFIGHRKFSNFIDDYLDPVEGRFVDVESGQNFAERHRGIHHFTVGQRVPLGGQKSKHYVVEMNHETQEVFVCASNDHPALFSDSFTATDCYWIAENLPSRRFHCRFRFQHTMPLLNCLIVHLENGDVSVSLEEPRRAIAPGQFAVFYTFDDICLGSAVISKRGPSYFELGKRVMVLDHKHGKERAIAA